MIAVAAGRRLHVACAGKQEAPFVLFDHGAYGIYADGWHVREALKSDFRVCLYDRAGMGWSDPAPAGQRPDVGWQVEDMRRLMAALDVAKPVYLVGHSMAGLRLHAFVNQYPDEIAGLVFIDAAAPQLYDVKRGKFRRLATLMRIGEFAAQTGLMRFAAPFMGDELGLPPGPARDKRRALARPQHHRAALAELLAIDFRRPYFQGRAAAAKPIAVFAQSPDGGPNAEFARAARTAGYYSHIEALPEESHLSLLNAENAQKIAGALREMAARVNR